ncbi:hypothetical protein ACGF7U_30980 [Micromonospora sp. NPDC047670]|uniref:hypothetical protein n=1 Tax=Micromonospora sp. NPDC047670 TaxID=3364252 RepID=UPI0037130DDC
MASTGPEATAQRDQNGLIGGWVRADPVRAVGIAMLLLSLAWRAQLASRGHLAVDDWVLIARAAESDLTPGFLLTLYNNHFMPAALLVTWLVTHVVGLAYWPYVLLLTAGQAVLAVAFFRLLRTLVRPGWALLVPLAVFLFSPLTLEATSWWAVGVNMLPMQLAMVLAVGAQFRYVRTGRRRHLLTLALAVVFGLLFFEKSLLVVPLVFLLTACFLVGGPPVRAVWDTVRRYWPSWAVLTAVSLGFAALYLSRSESSLRRPDSLGEVLSFLWQLLGSTVVPGLLGGPWQWLPAGDGAPVTAPPELARWLAWAVFLTLVAATVRLRRAAGRAWVLLGAYLALVTALLAATRLGSIYSDVAGAVPRYVSDVVVVAALCIGVALLGLAPAAGPVDGGEPEPADRKPGDPGADDRPPPALLARHRETVSTGLVLTLLAGGLGTAWTTARYGDEWAVKSGRTYLETARAELAAAPPGTVFFDQPVPGDVVPVLSAPYNRQSRFFHAMEDGPTFVTEAEAPSVFDSSGRIVPVRVDGPAARPGPEEGCGYKIIGGRTVRIPLSAPRDDWFWVVRIGYLSSADTTAVFRLGTGVREFPVKQGLHQYFFEFTGGGDTVELTVESHGVTVCTNEVTVGTPTPHE